MLVCIQTQAQEGQRLLILLQLQVMSIHFLYLLNPTQVRRGAGAYPSRHWAKGRVHPGQAASPSQGNIETNESSNHAYSLLG